MIPDLVDRGIVLLCDSEGIVLQLIRDDLGLGARVPLGSPLADLVDAGARVRVDHFVAELRSRDAAYDWEIAVPFRGTLLPLYFAGARADVDYLIVAACSRSGLAQINNELVLINNEQTNALRTAMKEMSLQARRPSEIEGTLYDDFSLLNNELSNLQREMAKKNAELEKLNQEKNYFLGMAAHDLRTPLGVILTYAEFLESEAFEVLTEEQRDFITRIKGTSEFMLRIVSNLLDVAAIESGNLKLDLQFADLVSVIQRTVTLNRVLAAKKEITVDLSIQEVSARLVIDSGKIEQVLNNLIGNAVKFSHRGTSIQVSLTLDPHYATVIVQDHGQGIPAEDVAKLFKAFGKGSVRGTAGEKCTGLGLAICHRIVEGHGGRIWVESTAGRGASFFFTLPLAMKEGRGTKP